jgi:hypothetical protein
MPRFFFDVINGANSYSDDTGIEIESSLVAREANRFLTDIAKEETPAGAPTHIAVQVRDASGREVFWGELTLQNRSQRDD